MKIFTHTFTSSTVYVQKLNLAVSRQCSVRFIEGGCSYIVDGEFHILIDPEVSQEPVPNCDSYMGSGHGETVYIMGEVA